MIRLVCFIAVALASSTLATSISHADVPTREDFYQQNTLRDVELSPNGRYLAKLTNEGNVRKVTVIDILDGGKTVMEFGDDIVRPFNLNWANNDQILINIISPFFRNQVKRGLKKGKDVRELGYRAVRRLITVTLGKPDYVEMMSDDSSVDLNYDTGRIQNILPNDPNTVQLTAYDDRKLSLFNASLKTGRVDKVALGSRNTYGFISDRNGKLHHRLDYLRSQKAVLIYDYTVDGGWVKKERIYFDELEAEATNGIKLEDLTGVLLDGSLVYRSRNEETGYYELLRRDRDGKTSLFASTPNADVLGVRFGHQSNEVVGYWTVKNDVLTEVYFDEATQAENEYINTQLREAGFLSTRIRQRAASQSRITVHASGMDNPGAYYLYDRSGKQLHFINFTNVFLPVEKLGLGAITSYKARDGQKVRAYMYLPNTYQPGKKFPAIVMPHGGPWVRDYATFNTIAQFLATRGYVVMRPNYRGSTGFGKVFQEAGYKQWGGTSQNDIEDAADFLVRKGLADPAKMCIFGISYGGYAALMGAMNDQLFQCAVSVNGVTHLPSLLSKERERLRDFPSVLEETYKRIGHPEKDKAMLREWSPALRAKDMKVPILLMGGREDRIVEFSQQKKMNSALKKAKKDFKFVVFDKGRHSPLARYEDMVTFYTELEAYLEKYLK